MTLTLVLSGILAPAIFWIVYFYYIDRYKPEPFKFVGMAYIMGMLCAYACLKFYGILPFLGLPEDPSAIMENNRLAFFWYCMGAVGILEELFKFLPFIIVIFCFRAFDEKIDSIIYSSIIALGFASFENTNYLVYLDGFELFGRAVASPITHAIFSSIWGYSVGVARLSKGSYWIAVPFGLIVSAVLHGLFDFLTTSPTLRLAASLVILAIWIWQLLTIDHLHKEEIKLKHYFPFFRFNKLKKMNN